MNTTSKKVLQFGTCLLLALSSINYVIAQDGPKMADIFKTPLASRDGMAVVAFHVDYPPGFTSPKHFHTGQVFVYVLEGSGAMEVAGDVQVASAGEVMHELANAAMVMRNQSESEWLRFVVFQISPEDAPPFVRVQ